MTDEQRAYHREYREKNIDRIRAYQTEYKRKWRAKNKDKLRGYYEKSKQNPNVKVWRKRSYERRKNDPAFKEANRKNQANWVAKNREKWNAYLREYRRRKKNENTHQD